MMHDQPWISFPAETLQRLFTAVEEDDGINADCELPASVDWRCPQPAIHRGYSLCLQFWLEGVSRPQLLQLIKKVMRGGELSPSEQMQYKFMRARYKHLRFAQRLYGRRHEADTVFRQTTVLLGHFQDAFRNGNQRNIKIYGCLLRIYLSRPLWLRMRYVLRHTRLDGERGFADYRKRQMQTLQQLIARPELSGEAFHSVRKIISQQVSFFDTVRSVDPDDRQALSLSRFLANINGVMGDRHDEMVADKLAGRRSYHAASPLAENIRRPVEAFLSRYFL